VWHSERLRLLGEGTRPFRRNTSDTRRACKVYVAPEGEALSLTLSLHCGCDKMLGCVIRGPPKSAAMLWPRRSPQPMTRTMSGACKPSGRQWCSVAWRLTHVMVPLEATAFVSLDTQCMQGIKPERPDCCNGTTAPLSTCRTPQAGLRSGAQ
jgi:hypothetical protein